ncbi:hypothetical protein C8D97_10598 [Pleionea mediterranea]|uniref:Uncharacterized protein n=1 Tax=Pleionea mediterranea TaxID=523701 RepID=A0A316FTU5_9GAMM|nr:hypothetical protein C8D97_10598 [Pleionea mediterranea]
MTRRTQQEWLALIKRKRPAIQQISHLQQLA